MQDQMQDTMIQDPTQEMVTCPNCGESFEPTQPNNIDEEVMQENMDEFDQKAASYNENLLPVRKSDPRMAAELMRKYKEKY